MMFEIKWKPKPLKFLKKLKKENKIRILDKIDLLKEDPFRYLEHFKGEGYKLRIATFRVLVDLEFNRKIIFINVIDKKSRIYLI